MKPCIYVKAFLCSNRCLSCVTYFKCKTSVRNDWQTFLASSDLMMFDWKKSVSCKVASSLFCVYYVFKPQPRHGSRVFCDLDSFVVLGVIDVYGLVVYIICFPTYLLSPPFRPHRSTAHVDAAYCYRPSTVVCWSVCHTCEPSKMAEPMEVPFGLRTQVGPWNHVLDGGPDPPWEGAILRWATHSKV